MRAHIYHRLNETIQFFGTNSSSTRKCVSPGVDRGQGFPTIGANILHILPLILIHYFSYTNVTSFVLAYLLSRCAEFCLAKNSWKYLITTVSKLSYLGIGSCFELASLCNSPPLSVAYINGSGDGSTSHSSDEVNHDLLIL